MQYYPIILLINTNNAGVYIFENINIFKLHTTITIPNIIVPYAHKWNVKPLLSTKFSDIAYVGRKQTIAAYQKPQNIQNNTIYLLNRIPYGPY